MREHWADSDAVWLLQRVGQARWPPLCMVFRRRTAQRQMRSVRRFRACPMRLPGIRWGVRGVLMLGVVASTIANILHAEPNGISRTIAAWPPLALLLTIELISRIPVHRVWLAATRLCAAAGIAGIAAWVSYWHMAGVALRYGEATDAAHLLPLSVDGLIVVASICLVELGGRISTAPEHPQPVEIVQRPVFDHARPIGPMPAPVKPRSGTAGGDDSAAQRQRADERSAQQKEAVVRAVKTADPDASLRWISAATLVPVSTVRNILSAAAEQPPEQVNGKVPELEDVSAGG
jgi:hypothetical protein